MEPETVSEGTAAGGNEARSMRAVFLIGWSAASSRAYHVAGSQHAGPVLAGIRSARASSVKKHRAGPPPKPPEMDGPMLDARYRGKHGARSRRAGRR